jgi:DNA invertase Pin-like site-specific DNA recombinase
LFLHQQALNTTGPMDKAMFSDHGRVQRAGTRLHPDPVRAGMARAKAAGKRIGRPPVSAAMVASIKAALRAGDGGVHKIAAAARRYRHGPAREAGVGGMTTSDEFNQR